MSTSKNLSARKIIRQFIKKRNLSPFEIETVRYIKGSIQLVNEWYNKEFYDYLEKNEKSFNESMAILGEESRGEMKKVMDQIKFVVTHSYDEMVKEVFDNEQQILDYIDDMKKYKHLKLHANLYQESIFKYRHGLVYVPEEKIKAINNKDFIDCGAYIGDSALVFETYYHPKNIYSFEPNKFNYNFLLETIKLNNLKKTIPVKLGVGSKVSSKKFKYSHDSSKVDKNGDNIIEITTIDKFVSSKNLDIGLIQMDVEGYELETLKGAVETIKEFKPILLICIYHSPEEFIEVIKIVHNYNLGYNIKIKHLGGFIRCLETHLIAW
ncbi:MAG: FkbM family methyltransferase [Promethearchaeota archaeon]